MPNDLDAKPVKRSDRKPSGCAALLVVLLALLPVLYLASTGPAEWLFEHGMLNENLVGFIYAPVNWACERSDIFASVTQAYVDWWAP